MSCPAALSWAHPVVQDWFVRRFGTPTEPQEQGWPHIVAGRSTLISAPTGSGKTLAAFLACIDRLVRKALSGDLQDRTEVLYVSPLKALGNDIQKNLETPLGEIMQLAAERGLLMPEIRSAVRTGDTLAQERRRMPLGPVASNELWEEMYQRICELVLQHRSTLVFVNTRRLAERVSHHLAEILGDDSVAAHHGSLSRKLRLNAERRLKAGEIKVLVATASLELGIDIGAVDLACLIGSPRSIATALQRVGRAGHWRGAVPKGRLFATTRDELIECAALVRAIRRGELDRLMIPSAPLDILAQQIVATSVTSPPQSADWGEGELFDLMQRAYPYRELARSDFDSILEMLSEGIAARRGRYGAYLHRDRVNGIVRARRGARLAAITSGGAIPDNALYSVVAEPEGTVVGTIDEDFAVESLKGDVILLGNTSWRIRRIESAGRVLVEDAHGAAPSIPFWLGEAPARTAELSREIAELRQQVSDFTPHTSPVAMARDAAEFAAAVAWLKSECGLDDSAAEQIVEYVVTGRAVLGAVPTQQTIIAERFFDEGGGMQLVIHAPFGARINKAWGLALRKRFCVSFNFELQAAATDNGLNISLAEQHSFPLADVFNFLRAETVEPVLRQAALLSPIFGTRWRWDANRSLALLRFQGGKKVPPQIQRIRSDDVLASVFPDVAACQENVHGPIELPDHPLVREVMKDVLHEAMDLDGLKKVLEEIHGGAVRCVAVDTPVPSVFSHEILNANPYAYLDDAPLEERRARAVEMRRVLPESVLEEVGKLDPAAIAQVREEAWPDVRDADELADALQTLVALPESSTLPEWLAFFHQLRAQRRALRAQVNGAAFWLSAEKLTSFRAVYPDAALDDTPPAISFAEITHDDAALSLVTGWTMHSGPLTASQLAQRLSLPTAEIEKTLIRLEAGGAILRGKFAGQTEEIEFCDRRLLARIHRLTLGTLRKQIEPVTAAQYMRWLLRWQHVAPGTQVSGERGTLEVLRQLQGFEIPASAWERQVLARRIADYDPKHLDQLCLTGAVGWGRLSPHPAPLEDSAEGRRRVVPTSVAPITFFLREEADWMTSRRSAELEDGRGLSPVAREVLSFLKSRGASFFTDIVRGTDKLKAEVETGLWELVAAGVITADGFDNLRALINPKRRTGQGY